MTSTLAPLPPRPWLRPTAGEARRQGAGWAGLDDEAARLVAWRTGLHEPGGQELTRWMMQRLDVARASMLAHLTPQWGSALTELMKREHRPAVRIAVVPDGQRRAHHDHRHTLWREGTPLDTGLVVGSVDAVVGEGAVGADPTGGRRTLQEASRVLRSGGLLALHELGRASTAGAVDHPLAVHPLGLGQQELRTPEGWQKELAAAGFSVIEMAESPWRVPTWRGLIQEVGLAQCFGRAHRLRRLDGSGVTCRRVRRGAEQDAADLVGVAFVARRR
ncbi:MAG: hypothetical protein AAF715_26205 [Myxococcota bacterium]